MVLENPAVAARPSARDVFQGSLNGAQDRPWIPHLRSDPSFYRPLPNNLLEFRQQEGAEQRERHFRQLWKRLPPVKRRLLDHTDHDGGDPVAVRAEADAAVHNGLSRERATQLDRQYSDELLGCCHGKLRGHIGWREFKAYAEDKEVGMCSLTLLVRARYIEEIGPRAVAYIP
jgi:solute carrier family 25 (mitochondrial phosphate transporter), member 23/24/25/41